MRIKRNVNAAIATEYNDLAKHVNDKRAVIFIQGDLYNEIKVKASGSKFDKGNKVLGGVLLAGGILTGGTLAVILGAINLTLGTVLKDKDFEDYKIKINKKNKRIELYLSKGPNKFDPRYDTIEV